jgi:hypothetical protein
MFFRPDGTCVEIAPAMPRGNLDRELPGLTAGRLTALGAATDPDTAVAPADHVSLDVAWAIDILRDNGGVE